MIFNLLDLLLQVNDQIVSLLQLLLILPPPLLNHSRIRALDMNDLHLVLLYTALQSLNLTAHSKNVLLSCTILESESLALLALPTEGFLAHLQLQSQGLLLALVSLLILLKSAFPLKNPRLPLLGLGISFSRCTFTIFHDLFNLSHTRILNLYQFSQSLVLLAKQLLRTNFVRQVPLQLHYLFL